MGSYFDENVARRGIASIYDPLILEASRDFITDPALIKAVIAAESSWNPNAYRAEPHINDASYGLMQILLGTAREMMPKAIAADLYVPGTNIRLGTRYLAAQLQRFGWPGGIYAYNGGPGNVSRNTVPESTLTTYFPTVDAYYAWYLVNDPALSGGGAGDPYPFPRRDRERMVGLADRSDPTRPPGSDVPRGTSE